MGNPIDWGGSPIAVGLVRGLIAAILIGTLQALIVHNGGNVSWETAITAGATAGIPVLLALLGYGAADQNRANNNIVIPGDVPEAAEGVVVKVK
jgi:hypothetical protein